MALIIMITIIMPIMIMSVSVLIATVDSRYLIAPSLVRVLPGAARMWEGAARHVATAGKKFWEASWAKATP